MTGAGSGLGVTIQEVIGAIEGRNIFSTGGKILKRARTNKSSCADLRRTSDCRNDTPARLGRMAAF